MTLQRQNSNTMPSRFKQNKPLISRQPLNKNELKNEISSLNVTKSNSKSENDIIKKELKLCSQVWSKLLKLPLIKYLEKKVTLTAFIIINFCKIMKIISFFFFFILIILIIFILNILLLFI